MNSELEELILAYEAIFQARDREEEERGRTFESLLDKVLERQLGLDRESLRKCVLRAHRQWALKQTRQPTAMPPKA